jgi:hypothetical protein
MVGSVGLSIVLGGLARTSQERSKLRKYGALAGIGLGAWGMRAMRGPSRNRPIGGFNFNPDVLMSIVDASAQVAGSGIQLGQQVSAQRAMARQQKLAAKQARAAAKDQARLLKAQAIQTAAEAKRLRAAGAASPLRQPAVVLSVIAVVGIAGIMLLKRKPEPKKGTRRAA